MQNTKTSPEGYAVACGVVGLILSILGFIVPIYGVMFGSAGAALFGVMAVYGRSRGLGIAILVLVAVNCVISPTWWAAVSVPEATGSWALAWISVLGVVSMLVLLARPTKA